MSWNPLLATGSPDAVGMDSIETLIVPRSVDVNPFIRRVLPAPQRQMVGPFIFFDQFGPLEVIASSAGDVRSVASGERSLSALARRRPCLAATLDCLGAAEGRAVASLCAIRRQALRKGRATRPDTG